MLYDLAALAVSLAALVVGAKIGGLLDAPLVGEIVVGLLLGPDGANFLPEPEAIVLVGNLGLCLLVMEGGLSIDLDTLRSVGRVVTPLPGGVGLLITWTTSMLYWLSQLNRVLTTAK
jgi:Kef-type K+ transport system membrane component KefB